MTWTIRTALGSALAITLVVAPAWMVAQQRGNNPFPGGTNPDGSLRPSAPLRNLFTQDAYTEYALLEPGSASFRIRFLPENSTEGATQIENATRGGSEGTGIEVYDPRTGQPVKFVYEPIPNSPDGHRIVATLPRPVPKGGIGRVLIYKTYKDDRTYMMNGEDLVWVRRLSGYRLGVILPRGFAFISSNIATQMTTTPDGRLKLAFANPSGQPNDLTVHARRTAAAFQPHPHTDVFFDDVKTLYDLLGPETGRARVEQTYSDYRKGATARLDALGYLPLQDLSVVDLDTAEPLAPSKAGKDTVVKLGVPIVDDRQSAHVRITGTLPGAFKVTGRELVFSRTLHGLRNTIVLPAGWEVSAVSQSATIGTTRDGRAFVALINLNAENSYAVTIRAVRP